MKSAVPEYMRVRTYLFNLIMDSVGYNCQIPSENELCGIFDVSRVTVRGAIKALVKEGYLIPRRGLGTFINPEKTGRSTLRGKRIGLIVEDGKHIINPYDPAVIETVTQGGFDFEPLYLPDSGKPETLLEITRNNMAGVIWKVSRIPACHSKYVELLRKNGIPVLLISEWRPDIECDYIVCTRFSRGKVVADHMFSKGHKRVLFIHNDKSETEHFDSSSTYYGFSQRMTDLCGDEWGTMSENIVLCLNLQEKLKAILSGEEFFSAVYSAAYLAPFISDAFDSAGLSVPDDISYLVYGKSNRMLFSGREPDFIDNKTAMQDEVFQWLRNRTPRRGGKNDKSAFHREIYVKSVSGDTVANLEV